MKQKKLMGGVGTRMTLRLIGKNLLRKEFGA